MVKTTFTNLDLVKWSEKWQMLFTYIQDVELNYKMGDTVYKRKGLRSYKSDMKVSEVWYCSFKVIS